MAFVVEDGTGLSNSNSLCSVTFADTYFADREVSAWAALTTEKKQAALISATDYLGMVFEARMQGERGTSTQALCFPRTAFAAVPAGVQKAVAQYALRASTAKLLPDPVIDPTGVGVERTRKRVGPIEKETRYQIQGPGSSRILIRPYPEADMLVKPFLKSSGGVIRG